MGERGAPNSTATVALPASSGTAAEIAVSSGIVAVAIMNLGADAYFAYAASASAGATALGSAGTRCALASSAAPVELPLRVGAGNLYVIAQADSAVAASSNGLSYMLIEGQEN